MNIIQLITERQNDPTHAKIPTIAFLGDSVTHGCFDLYPNESGGFLPVFDQNAVYHSNLSKLLHLLYPTVSINIVNAGINGNRAVLGLERLERDVLAYHPDLTVVDFGLNDVHRGEDGLTQYRESLSAIFQKLKASGSEVILMTPNMMNTKKSGRITMEILQKTAEKTMTLQNDGTFDAYVNAAREAAAEQDVPVCDVYAKWQCLYRNGVRTDDLLSNQINHPTREMHWLFAYSLLETMMT